MYLHVGVAELVQALRYKPEGRGFDSLQPHFGPGVDSICNINEYQGFDVCWTVHHCDN